MRRSYPIDPQPREDWPKPNVRQMRNVAGTTCSLCGRALERDEKYACVSLGNGPVYLTIVCHPCAKTVLDCVRKADL